MSEVVAVKRGENYSIVAYKLDDGRVVDSQECAELIRTGEIKNLSYQSNTRGESGVPIIRSKPDGITENNLQNLPEFE